MLKEEGRRPGKQRLRLALRYRCERPSEILRRPDGGALDGYPKSGRRRAQRLIQSFRCRVVWDPKLRHSSDAGLRLCEELQRFSSRIDQLIGNTCDVAAGTREADDKA